MIRRPPRSTQSRSSAASDVYKRQDVGQLVWLYWSRPPVRQRFRKLQRLWTGPWRIEAFKSPLVVVIKHTAKRTRQTVHVDRLILCQTPPPAVSDVDSGVPPDSETVTDELTTPDEGTQPSLGGTRTASPGGTLSPSPSLSPPLVRGDQSALVDDRRRWTPIS